MTTISAPTTYRPIAARTRLQLAASAQVLLRVGVGALFMQHGLQKLFGMFGGMGAPGAAVPLMSQFGAAGVLELVGGFFLVIGLLTRPVAFLLMGEMLVAFAMVHLPKGGAPIQNGGELALLYALIFAFIAGNGATGASVDAALGARHATRRAS